MHARSQDLTGVVELHPALVTLAMLGGLGVTLTLAWVLPNGAGGPVFVLGLIVFAIGWPFLLALHLEETFGAFTEVNRWLVTACYLAALVLLPLALVIIELFTDLGWSLLFLLAWAVGCVAVGYLLWTATQALVFVEERRWVAPEQRVPTFLMMFVLPATIPYLQHRLRTALSEAREDEWIAV
jgi:acyl-CoA synthetase (AMP-forming)/AMP-acid ligase II